MNTQPQFRTPGARPPPRSRRRPPDRPALCHPLSRRPRPGPSSTQAASPTVAPRPPVPPSPPSPRLPTRPSRPDRTTPSTYPNWPKSDAPRPQEFFGKNSYAHKAPQSPRRRSATNSPRPSAIPAPAAATPQPPASRDSHTAPSLPPPSLTAPSLRHFTTPDARQFAPKIRLKLSLASRSPEGTGWPEIAPPFSPSPPAPPRPTVTLTPRTPKAREGLADGRRNHRSRG